MLHVIQNLRDETQHKKSEGMYNCVVLVSEQDLDDVLVQQFVASVCRPGDKGRFLHQKRASADVCMAHPSTTYTT